MIVLLSAVLVITGPLAVRKNAAALFRREKFILLQVCITGGHLVFTLFTRKELGTRCSHDFACATAGELSSISIYTLRDLGVLSNLIGSLSLANKHYSPPTE